MISTMQDHPLVYQTHPWVPQLLCLTRFILTFQVTPKTRARVVLATSYSIKKPNPTRMATRPKFTQLSDKAVVPGYRLVVLELTLARGSFGSTVIKSPLFSVREEFALTQGQKLPNHLVVDIEAVSQRTVRVFLQLSDYLTSLVNGIAAYKNPIRTHMYYDLGDEESTKAIHAGFEVIQARLINVAPGPLCGSIRAASA
ncbi:MAG: matrix protein [Carlia munda bornavirus]|uniref:Matrix protein n=1 Tax=Carlia munda bornavirus TaxID=3141953 RepID=A0AAU7SS75_9MONO